MTVEQFPSRIKRSTFPHGTLREMTLVIYGKVTWYYLKYERLRLNPGYPYNDFTSEVPATPSLLKCCIVTSLNK